MSVEFRAGDPDDARRQIEPFERELRGAGCGDGRGNDGRQGRHAADAGFEAESAVALVRAGRRRSLG